MTELHIVGAGGFGREVADIVDAINAVSPTWRTLLYIDDAPDESNRAKVQHRGSRIVGSVQDVLADHSPGPFVVAVGLPDIRARIVALFERAGWTPTTLVHPSSAVSRTAELGSGSVVAAYAAVGADVLVGRHVHIDRAAQVGHDTVIGDFTTIHPSAVISGDCSLGAGVRIGTTATVLPGIAVGERAFVGAAACVVRPVQPGATVSGVPAR